MGEQKEKLEVKKFPDGMEYIEMPYNGTILIIRNSIEPGRMVEETREEYIVRRKLTNSRISKYLKGNMFWTTGLLGTYSRAKLNELTDELLKEEEIKKEAEVRELLGTKEK